VPVHVAGAGRGCTLLFTNSGMVQFKDVFLGTDKLGHGAVPYTRAVDSQKCMRVAGKHNDLDDVGRDDTHHTFFEMLGNWSFGDYYKEEAIAWSWQLLTDVWGLPKDKLYATCFKDDKGQRPDATRKPPTSGRNSPDSTPATCCTSGARKTSGRWPSSVPAARAPRSTSTWARNATTCAAPDQCGVNGECTRYLELWNNVFIQYNLFEDGRLEPLPAKHVDTGMGFERIVSVLQGVDSNYKTDLFSGAMDVLRSLTGKTESRCTPISRPIASSPTTPARRPS
jgi:alanyl-tRNA synthetase